jgi:flagellar protein FlaF
MIKSALKAYGDSSKMGLSGRVLEAEAFSIAARKLQDARDHIENRRLVMSALRYNNRLWTIVQASLGDPKSLLPTQLTAQLASLSLFIDDRTREAIITSDPELLDILIEINGNLAMAQFST